MFGEQRPVVLNGIEEIATRPDLVDGAVTLTLQPICPTNRKTESEFWSAFDDVHPSIHGGLLHAVAVGLRTVSTVQITALPRMADFAVWGTACESALGLSPGEFLAAYTANKAEASSATI